MSSKKYILKHFCQKQYLGQFYDVILGVEFDFGVRLTITGHFWAVLVTFLVIFAHIYYENTIFWAWITPFPTDSDWSNHQIIHFYILDNILEGVGIAVSYTHLTLPTIYSV